MWGSKFEVMLPAQPALIVSIKLSEASTLGELELKRIFREAGYFIARNKISIVAQDSMIEWRFVAVGRNRRNAKSIPELAQTIRAFPELKNYHLMYARN
jgi:hypothetical protein